MATIVSIPIADVLLKSISESPQESDQRALCCVLGALAGDNLGSYNEFEQSVTKEELDMIVTMPGGGAHSLIPGQPTDDSEMAISLGYALLSHEGTPITTLDCNAFSKYYGIWLRSSPFDVGMTIGQALNVSRRETITLETPLQTCREDLLLAHMNRWSVKLQNTRSQSNGGCMRITPLIVYLSKQTDQEVIRRVVRAEQSLTHSHEIVMESSYVYVRLCINLIQGMSASDAYADLEKYFADKTGEKVVRSWWKDMKKDQKFENASQSMGWIKHALTQCFLVLKRLADSEKAEDTKKSELYQKHIRDIIRLCGDSDTNCAIVGGMLGAYLKLAEFPVDYLRKLLVCEVNNKESGMLHPRDPLYNPRNAIYIVSELLKRSPAEGQEITIIDEVFTEVEEKKVELRNAEITKQRLAAIYKEQAEKEEAEKSQTSTEMKEGEQEGKVAEGESEGTQRSVQWKDEKEEKKMEEEEGGEEVEKEQNPQNPVLEVVEKQETKPEQPLAEVPKKQLEEIEEI